MSKEYDNVDMFLRNATFEVEDNGFTERIIGQLSKHAEWERKLQRIWQLVCLAAAIVVGWLTNIVDVIRTDLKVMLDTLPLNYSIYELCTMAMMPMFALCILMLLWGKKVIY